VPRDNRDAAQEDSLLLRLEALAARLSKAPAGGVPVPRFEDLLNDAGKVDLAPRFSPPRREVSISWDDRLDLLTREFLKAAAELVLAEIPGPAGGTPTPAKASARSVTKPPPLHLVVAVLILLIAVLGPVAGEKLPPEIQVMLSTEVGTISLALAIIQMMNQKRK
jgi:hypothetical protein